METKLLRVVVYLRGGSEKRQGKTGQKVYMVEVAMDEESVVMKSWFLENSKRREEEKEGDPVYEYGDIRLFPGLDPSKSFAEKREVFCEFSPYIELENVTSNHEKDGGRSKSISEKNSSRSTSVHSSEKHPSCLLEAQVQTRL